MGCTEILKARVSPEIKLQAKAVADREFLSEAAWLKRLVLREIRACDAATTAAKANPPRQKVFVGQAGRHADPRAAASPCSCD